MARPDGSDVDGVVRPARPDDTDEIVEVWYEASKIAHDFMGEEFLERERGEVAKHWLPVAETTVVESDGRVVGFVSLVGNEVGGLFVHPEYQGRGIGRTLIEHSRAVRTYLELGVFEANARARHFYGACGFEQVGSHEYDGTGHIELRLRLDPEVDRTQVVRIERSWARAEAEFARTLALQDPSRGSTAFRLADGVVVLTGPGLFVNQALGLGLEADVAGEQLDEMEAWAAAVGVAPAVEVTGASRPSLVPLLVDRGYEPGTAVSALVHPIEGDPGPPDPTDPEIVIETVGPDSLPLWQEVAAAGWGHAEPQARRASDAVASAALAVDVPGLLLARSDSDGRPLGCAALRVVGDIATLGGMTTLPAERGRGIQRAMILHRLALAAALGGRVATVSAEAGSRSERNLRRHGFELSHSKVTYTKAT
ncbi:MAG: GNAT family N-acetyltransferase [Ilumatobacteraceae bacterium]